MIALSSFWLRHKISYSRKSSAVMFQCRHILIFPWWLQELDSHALINSKYLEILRKRESFSKMYPTFRESMRWLSMPLISRTRR